MDKISDEELEFKVAELLEVFYKKRIQKLQDIELRKVLKEKNPYLYRATSTNDASEIVKNLLNAKISSSDETIFGNDFFEPLAVWIAQQANHTDPDISADYASGSGGDLQIVSETRYSFYAIKSGISVFNGASKKRQLQEFNEARSRLFKTRKQFDPVIAFGYGRKRSKATTHREVAGQEFWFEISGDSNMYMRIIAAMGRTSIQKVQSFQVAYGDAVKRFTTELLANFAHSDGSLDWEKLTMYNSMYDDPGLTWVSDLPSS